MAELSVAEKTKQALSNLGAQEPNFDVTPTQSMLQTRSSFQTAVSVIRPRNLELVLRRCLDEAAIAGDEFFYGWDQGGESIEGLTVGAALSIVRNFGNCAVEVKTTDLPTSYLFDGVFVDLETGFNLVRPYRQNKQSPKKKNGKDIYTGDRAQDVLFQIGASKAIRNVVLNAVPKWIGSKVMEVAKENVISKFEKLGIEKVKAAIFKRANAQKIEPERIESVYGREKTWDIVTAVKIVSAIRAIEDGVEKAEDLFPVIAESGSKSATTEQETTAQDPTATNEAVNTKTGEITQQMETTQEAPADPMAPTSEEAQAAAYASASEKYPNQAVQPQEDKRQLHEILASDISALDKKNASTSEIQVWYQQHLGQINELPNAKKKVVMSLFSNVLAASKERA